MNKQSKQTTPKKHRRIYTDAEIIKGLKAAHGFVTLAANQILHCDPCVIYRRAKKSEKIRQVLAQERELTVDIAEAALRGAIIKGEGWAVCFALKCLAKNRGYVERQEITGADGGALNVVLKWEANGADSDRDNAESSSGAVASTK